MLGGHAAIAYWERNIGRRRHGTKLLDALSGEHQVWMQCLLGAEGTNYETQHAHRGRKLLKTASIYLAV